MIGDCAYCNSQEVFVYTPSQLSLFFKGIIDLYEVDNESDMSIGVKIIEDFKNKVFTSKLISSNNIDNLIRDIIIDDKDSYQSILENPVALKISKTLERENANQTLFLSWDKFSKEIKTTNRFHLENSLDLIHLKSLFQHYVKELPMGRKFYRARISNDKVGYSVAQMGNPPSNLAKAGRANPEGISYLYLSNNIKTTLYEVRASHYDYVTVGAFRLEESISVVNLNRLTYDVFRLAEIESLEEVIIHGSFIDKLEKELSKPRRRSDSELDYIPTQYISELIKSMGFDGIEFTSSLYAEGVNLAIFNPEKFSCLSVDVYEVVDLKLDYNKVL